ncbi:uncharacterized protein YjaG (DUF416 family) [Croceifilum oryzae]|uniref:Uncharacterized protein YjaG (DUF416 family) n=1 Tax=Croceifilum oryzae TaxID=1553429 RepID=A0AAJ1WSP4_9BACL|nr:DUF416 family protein [Croceifilum oryzae]MDQ0417940.1 uncharacterized protein YjaG (DUF416 family) [Croceifilum oryzae]
MTKRSVQGIRSENVLDEFDQDWLEEELSQFNEFQRAAFSASCAERMIKNYERFYEETGWGNPDLLKKALSEVWKSLSLQEVDPEKIELLRNQVTDIAPDTEDFETIYVSCALDATTAVNGALDSLITQGADGAVGTAIVSVDTVDMYVQELLDLTPFDQEREKKIVEHPLMVRELQKITSDMELISKTPTLSKQFIDSLRMSSTGTSSLGFS